MSFKFMKNLNRVLENLHLTVKFERQYNRLFKARVRREQRDVEHGDRVISMRRFKLREACDLLICQSDCLYVKSVYGQWLYLSVVTP